MGRRMILSVLLIASISVFGQGLGRIGGTVADPSGALVPGVKITATEVGTKLSRSALSDEQGLFVIPSLRPAIYDVVAELPGFRNFTQRGITLLADQSLTVNIMLQVGTSSEAVTVESTPPAVNTTTSSLGQVIELSRVVDLPSNGRNAAALTLLVPGAVSAPDAGAGQGTTKTIPGAVTISANGSRHNTINYMLDGSGKLAKKTTGAPAISSS